MARRRMIDPNIWHSEDFSKLSMFARLVFIGMFSNADDEGRGRAKPVYLKSVIFPYDEDVRVADIDKTLLEIGSKMSVTFYQHDGNAYYSFDNWQKWQRVDKPQESKIPAPESVENHSGVIPESVENHSGLKERKGKEKKEKGKEEKRNARTRTRKDFVPPTLEEVKAYVKERNNDVDAKRFFDYFEAGDWLDSEGKPVLNWKQKLITWEKKRGGARKADLNINSYQGVKLDGIIEVE